ncbi:Pyridinium-3,5-bisthiocarboxylic acid mononucleotide synthase [Methanosarcinales archaeon]|nr:Pyridinium-3,5-bisthiocarboxylic acid mononucleotide synthase [Methanosarcinales archaeon]
MAVFRNMFTILPAFHVENVLINKSWFHCFIETLTSFRIVINAMSPDEKMQSILADLAERGSVLIAFSGGVDSSVLAALAFKALGKNSIAVTADSQTLAPGELDRAKAVAKEIGILHKTIYYDELGEPGFAENPVNRCYHCKKGLIKELKKIASDYDIKTIIEGTNISDLKNHRPGYMAIVEEGIYNPFVKFKVTKEEIRDIARKLGLSVADKPSMACLSSRFPYGQTITADALRRVGVAENYLHARGFTVVRVRDHSGIARIEITPDEMVRLMEMRDEICAEFKRLGFSYVTLDLMGFRSGSMDEVL